MIAEFTLPDGRPVTTNLDRLDYFEPCEVGTRIHFADGRELEIVDSYDAVAELLNPERQAGL
ncbi:hypothetical protein [Sphingobium yanoikuyae]|jgi:DNA-binding LytR/AlgR family response regulator|uniref:hypothetical protein n=1 Tax=Sphingobium yanoikuyae TaxID=13690 RepID=UPI000846B295|nr:hypothetical protein [Sphingobium yanoikuyae]